MLIDPLHYRRLSRVLSAIVLIGIQFTAYQNCSSYKSVSNENANSLACNAADPLCQAAQQVSLSACAFAGKMIADGQSVTAYKSQVAGNNGLCTQETRTCQTGVLSGTYAFDQCGSQSDCLFNGQVVANGTAVAAYFAAKTAPNRQCRIQARVCNNGVLSGTFAYSNCAVDPNMVDPYPTCSFNGDNNIVQGESLLLYQAARTAPGGSCVSELRTCNSGQLSGSFQNTTCLAVPASCTFNGTTVPSNSSTTAYFAARVPGNRECRGEGRFCSNGMLQGTYQYSSCAKDPSWIDPNPVCTIFGQPYLQGESVIAYKDEFVPPGSSCQQEIRTCNNGVMTGSFTSPRCLVNQLSCTFNGASVPGNFATVGYLSPTVPANSKCLAESRMCVNGILNGSYQYPSCTVLAK